MGYNLIGPLSHARFWIARPDRAGPPVVSGTHIRIPNARVAGAVIDEIEFRIVRDPAPHSTAAHLPLVRCPAFHALVCSLVFRVKSLEAGSNERVLVRAGAIGDPTYFARLQIKRHEPAANP